MNGLARKRKKASCMLFCIGTVFIILASAKAFAFQPLQNTTPSPDISVVRDSNLVQTETLITNGLYELITHNAHVDNLSSGLDNQECQGAILSTNGTSSIIGYIQYENDVSKPASITSYTNAKDFVDAINKASDAHVYLCKNVVIGDPIEIQSNATITIHLCGHVLSGADIGCKNSTFSECVFKNNITGMEGSALCDWFFNNTLKNCTITENKSKNNNGAVFAYYLVDLNLEGVVTISNNTGNDVYLKERPAFRTYIMIDPNKFDLQSRVGVFIEDIDNGVIFAKTKVGTGNFPVLAKDCFYINNGSYSVVRDDEDRTRLLVVKA